MQSIAPDKNTPQNPRPFFAARKNPGVHYRLKNNPIKLKFQTPKNPSDCPVMPIVEWGPWDENRERFKLYNF